MKISIISSGWVGMAIQVFKEMVKKGESEEVEFKKSTAQLDRALKSVCGF
jgi:predicted HTH transcriptional regulator